MSDRLSHAVGIHDASVFASILQRALESLDRSYRNQYVKDALLKLAVSNRVDLFDTLREKCHSHGIDVMKPMQFWNDTDDLFSFDMVVTKEDNLNLFKHLLHLNLVSFNRVSNYTGYTVFLLAACANTCSVFRFMCKLPSHVINAEKTNYKNQNVLHLVCKNNNLAGLQVAVDSGCFSTKLLCAQDSEGNTPLHIVVLCGGSVALLQELLKIHQKHGVPLDIQNGLGYTPIMIAVKRNCIEMVSSFVLGVSRTGVNVLTYEGEHVLGKCCKKNYRQMADILISNFDISWSCLHTGIIEHPLVVATKKGFVQLVKNISKHVGIHINDIRGHHACTLLHCAAMGNSLCLTEFFLKMGQYVDVTNDFDETAMHIAIQENNKDVAMLLLDNGADVNCQDNHGLTCLMASYEYMQDDMPYQLFGLSDTRCNLLSLERSSVLHYAAGKNDCIPWDQQVFMLKHFYQNQVKRL